MPEQPTPKALHERIIRHLSGQQRLVAVSEPVNVEGVKTTQGDKPILAVDCPNCPNVYGMSGHDGGRSICNVCATVLMVTPVDPPTGWELHADSKR